MKNEIVEKQIDTKTENDPVMKDFLMTIIESDTNTQQYKKAYETAIEKAIKAEVEDEI